MTEPLVVLLHGWPGLPSDYDRVIALLPGARCVAPPLLGIGEGFRGAMAPGSASADAHARRLLSTLPGDAPLLVVGYDIGSRVAQAMLAGVLLPLCLAPITGLVANPWGVVPVVITWLVFARLAPRWAVPLAFVAPDVTGSEVVMFTGGDLGSRILDMGVVTDMGAMFG